MRGIKKILDIELKSFFKELGKTYVVGFLISLIIGFFVRDNASFTEAFRIILTLLLILVTIVTVAITAGASSGKTFPFASRLGINRKDIGKSLILRDLIILVFTSLILWLASELLVDPLTTRVSPDNLWMHIYSYFDMRSLGKVVYIVTALIGLVTLCSTMSLELELDALSGAIWGLAIFLGLITYVSFNDLSLVIKVVIILGFVLAQVYRLYALRKIDY